MHNFYVSDIFQGEFTGLMILSLWWLSMKTPLPPRARIAANALGAMAVLQVSTVNWLFCYLCFLYGNKCMTYATVVQMCYSDCCNLKMLL